MAFRFQFCLALVLVSLGNCCNAAKYQFTTANAAAAAGPAKQTVSASADVNRRRTLTSIRGGGSFGPFGLSKKDKEPPKVDISINLSSTAGELQEYVQKRLEAAGGRRRYYQDNPEKAQSVPVLLNNERLPEICWLSLLLGEVMGIVGFVEEDARAAVRRNKRKAKRETERAKKKKAFYKKNKKKIQNETPRERSRRETAEQVERLKESVGDWWEDCKIRISEQWDQMTSRGGLLNPSTWKNTVPYDILLDSPPTIQCAVGLAVGMTGWPFVWSLGATGIGAGGIAYLASEVRQMVTTRTGQDYLIKTAVNGDEDFDLIDEAFGKAREGVVEGIRSANGGFLLTLGEEIDKKSSGYPSNVIRGIVAGLIVGATVGA